MAYSPPLTGVTVQLHVVSPTLHYYTWAVSDTIRGTTPSGMSAFISGAPAASNYYIVNNVVIILSKTASENRLQFATYDPKRGQWMSDSATSSPGLYVSFSAGNDGTIVWEEYDGTISNGWQIRMAVYDPAAASGGGFGKWVTSSLFLQPSSGVRYIGLDHGVIGWIVSYNSFNDQKAGWCIYDPVSHTWKTGSTFCNSYYLSMSNGSVTIDDFIYGVITKGYDPYSGSGVWATGNTKSKAVFVCQTVGTTAVLTDMSIGGTTWDWDLGDGNTSTSRSLVHQYSASPPITVQLDIAGMDSVNRNVSYTILAF